jgi:aspartate ammonia-lyase
MTGFPLIPAKNTFEALQSARPVQTVSSALKELALELIRVANDLRLLSSGPTTGLSEIDLPPVQPGSSIMPGKVNPVMAECLDMIAFQVVGNDLTVSSCGAGWTTGVKRYDTRYYVQCSLFNTVTYELPSGFHEKMR